MSASNRLLLPLLALGLLAAGTLHGCGGAECLRDSDCGSHLECRVGACTTPLPRKASVPADGGQGDGATPDGVAGMSF